MDNFLDCYGTPIKEGDFVLDLIENDKGYIVNEDGNLVAKFSKVTIPLNSTYSEENETLITGYWQKI